MSVQPDPYVVRVERGSAPLLVSLPHDGSFIPAPLAARMHPQARCAPDTDWHVSRLYDFARELGATLLIPSHSRYVVDLNRPADGAALYPGRRETGLVPTVRFDEGPIYFDGQEPDVDEVRERIVSYWKPYHDALKAELDRLRAGHEHVVLWDGHSIRSQVPMFFEGRLPDFNLGTGGGSSCDPALQSALEDVLARQTLGSWVSNGRFKGGNITRHYGRPGEGVHAVQMELVQARYMREDDSFEYRPDLAGPTRDVLRDLLQAALRFATRGMSARG